MFSREEILRSAMLIAIGGIVALLVSKLLEGDEGATAPRGITGEDELNETKQPQEHDERFAEGVSAIVHISKIFGQRAGVPNGAARQTDTRAGWEIEHFLLNLLENLYKHHAS